MSDDNKNNPVVGYVTFGPFDPNVKPIDVPNIMLQSGFEKGFAAGIEAAAKLMDENAKCFEKSGQDVYRQLMAEARHIRELIKK